MREEIIGARGLFTNPNPQKTPPGAMFEAQDVVIDRPDLVGPRPGMDRTVTTSNPTLPARSLVPFSTHVFSLCNGVCVDDTAGAAVSGFTNPPISSSRSYATIQARGSLYCTGYYGMQKLDKEATSWQDSGVQKSLGGAYTVGAGGQSDNWLLPNYATAYRVVLRRTDPSAYIRRSAPSTRILVQNGTGVAGRPTLTLDLQADVRSGDVLEIYRASSVDATLGEPLDQMFMVVALDLTAAQISSRLVTFLDTMADKNLAGQELYTNSTQDGALLERGRPPWAADVALFNRMAAYGYTQTPYRFELKLWRDGVETNPVITGTEVANHGWASQTYGANASSGNLTCTAGNFTIVTAQDLRNMVGCVIVEGFKAYPGASGLLQAFTKIVSAPDATHIVVDKAPTGNGTTAGSTTWPTLTVGGVSVYGTDRNNTATSEWKAAVSTAVHLASSSEVWQSIQQLCHLINTQQSQVSVWPSGNSFIPYVAAYNSAAQANWDTSRPALVFESRQMGPNVGAPTIAYNDGSNTGVAYSQPFMAAGVAQSFTADSQSNCVWFSRVDEPEAVSPVVGSYLVGDSAAPIRRLVSTQTALWVFKDDGIFRISGFSPEAMRVDLMDPAVRILASEAACAAESAVYAWTSRGVAIVSDAGIRIISDVIRDELLLTEQSLVTWSGTRDGVQMVYDRLERRVYLTLPADESNQSLTYVWHENSQVWTRWVLSGPMAAMWDPATGLFTWSWVDPGQADKRVIIRSRSRTAAVFTGDYPTAINISVVTPNSDGTFNLTLTTPTTMIQGDGIVDVNGNFATIVSASDTTHCKVRATNIVAGVATFYTSYASVAAWQVKPQPSPFEQKIYQDIRLILNDMNLLDGLIVEYSSFVNQAAPLFAAVNARDFPFVDPAVGDGTVNYARRIGVPQGVARAALFDVKMTFRTAMASWQIGGFAVTYVMGGTVLSS